MLCLQLVSAAPSGYKYNNAGLKCISIKFGLAFYLTEGKHYYLISPNQNKNHVLSVANTLYVQQWIFSGLILISLYIHIWFLPHRNVFAIACFVLSSCFRRPFLRPFYHLQTLLSCPIIVFIWFKFNSDVFFILLSSKIYPGNPGFIG